MVPRLLTCLLLSMFCVAVGRTTIGQEAPQITGGTKSLPLPGETFKLNGNEAFVILPATATANTPWVWYAPTLRGLPGKAEVWMFERFLAAGIAIAGIDVGESFGSPQGCQTYSSFYQYLVKTRGFSPKPVLLARSRGGLMLYSWAADHPQFVAGIGGIYPVCNIASYPGLDRACGAFGLTADQLRDDLPKYNPIDRLAGLATARVPVFHIHGDNDQVVPLAANSALLADRFRQLGGEMTLEVIEGQGHNMWPGWFQSEKLTAFLIAHAAKPQ